MRYRLPVLAIVALTAIPALAAADLICPGEAGAPLSAGAIVEKILPTFLESGISVLFLSALTVVGVPWALAGVAVALLAIPGRRDRT